MLLQQLFQTQHNIVCILCYIGFAWLPQPVQKLTELLDHMGLTFVYRQHDLFSTSLPTYPLPTHPPVYLPTNIITTTSRLRNNSTCTYADPHLQCRVVQS